MLLSTRRLSCTTWQRVQSLRIVHTCATICTQDNRLYNASYRVRALYSCVLQTVNSLSRLSPVTGCVLCSCSQKAKLSYTFYDWDYMQSRCIIQFWITSFTQTLMLNNTFYEWDYIENVCIIQVCTTSCTQTTRPFWTKPAGRYESSPNSGSTPPVSFWWSRGIVWPTSTAATERWGQEFARQWFKKDSPVCGFVCLFACAVSYTHLRAHETA